MRWCWAQRELHDARTRPADQLAGPASSPTAARTTPTTSSSRSPTFRAPTRRAPPRESAVPSTSRSDGGLTVPSSSRDRRRAARGGSAASYRSRRGGVAKRPAAHPLVALVRGALSPRRARAAGPLLALLARRLAALAELAPARRGPVPGGAPDPRAG